MINNPERNIFTASSEKEELTLKKAPKGWEVWSVDIALKAASYPTVQLFRSLGQVESKYKAFKGISKLVKA